jgi:hypothetical protein
VAYAPLLLLGLASLLLYNRGYQAMPYVTVILLAAWFAGGLYAVLHPDRGLQDRLAGTWLVPR